MEPIRNNSISTTGGTDRAMSIFSEGYQTATTATSPATSLADYSSAEDGEIFEIDQETFDKNAAHIRKDSCQSDKPTRTSIINDEEPKFINGSTLGGNDPLHTYIRAYDMEPKWWTEERQREDRRYSRPPPTTKRKRSAPSPSLVVPTYLDPSWYDALPYSPQETFTSGLDMDAEPEVTAEQFWEKVLGAWKLSMRFESVDERREAFEVEFFETVLTPGEGGEGGLRGRGEFWQDWFEEELTVGETW